jgi:2-oxoglutarate dehydrogenase E2 component (dihydrolipoamide succinyltransferase)
MADVTMPQLGETVTEGTITKWFKQVGEEVKADEPLFEVSTEKVDTEVPSPISGVLTEIKVNEGDTVEVGAVIAVVGGASAAPGAAAPASAEAPPSPAPEPEPAPASTGPAADEAPSAPAPAAAPASPPEAASEAAVAAPASAEAPPATGDGDNRLLSPVVRRLVNEHGIDPAQIQGSGAGGRITREDVLAHIEHGPQPAPAEAPPAAVASPQAPPAPAEAPPAPAEAPAAPTAAPVPAPAAPAVAAPRPAPAVHTGERDEVVKLTKIRQLTGEHMVMSTSVAPHAFSVVEVDYATVDRVRNAVADEWKASEGFTLTYLPFISRAVIDAIGDFPHMNASVGQGELIVHRYVDLGIAVDLAYQGLLVPVIREADTKRLRAIAREIFDLATRAKTRKLLPDEIQGGTFTISNNGSAGSVLTAAIINQPQVAILSTDAIKRRPVAVDLGGGQEGIAIHPVGNLAMSWDHRAFDGAYAANFLVQIKEILEARDWEAEL